MTDRAAAIQAALRRKNLESVRRSRKRRAGLLPPLPTCPNCGAQCRTDRWLPLCSICARKHGIDFRHQVRGTPRPSRIAAEQILDELRANAWAETRHRQT